MTKKSLQSRKQQVVRDAIYDAAIELFISKGFDETTIDDVAVAVGISQRSFFRYFASKDDLLAVSVVKVGSVLAETVAACPANFTTLQIVRETVVSALNYSASRPRIHQVVEIAMRSTRARQAYMSHMIEVEDKLADVLAARLRGPSGASLKPRMLAGVTLSIMNASVSSWFLGEFKDLNTAGKRAFADFTRVVTEKEV
jgi:AcrR family transcriptional regulator